jgi:Ca2+-binding EF-hand superfamily protein
MNDHMNQVTTITKEEQQELTATFRMFDLNNDGHICQKELGIVMKQLGRETSDADLKSEYLMDYIILSTQWVQNF